jgi:SAM-dependent methyltransferase
MIPDPKLNIWEHSRQLKRLCWRRGFGLEPEMDCAAQGAHLLAPFVVEPNLKLLDVGCGGAHFYRTITDMGLKVDYYGLDYAPSMVKIAKTVLSRQGLDPSRIMLEDVGDLNDFECQLVVMINTLSFNADFRRPLQRLVDTGAEAIIIRDFFGQETIIKWEEDGYLDPAFNHLKGYWNQWSGSEVSDFLETLGYCSTFIPDQRTKGQIEYVVTKPYRWSWLVATKK